MASITDRLFELEHKLDKDEGFLSRRLVLRQFAEAVAADARKEGYHDGMRDALDASAAEKEAARQEESGA
jgi:hypothetical protein